MIETLEITGTKKETFAGVINLLQAQGNRQKIVGYDVIDDNILFYWFNSSECKNVFPYELTLEQATDFMWGWIENTEPKEKQQIGDGSSVKGFYIEYGEPAYKSYDESNIPVFNHCFLRVKPTWIYYGK